MPVSCSVCAKLFCKYTQTVLLLCLSEDKSLTFNSEPMFKMLPLIQYRPKVWTNFWSVLDVQTDKSLTLNFTVCSSLGTAVTFCLFSKGKVAKMMTAMIRSKARMNTKMIPKKSDVFVPDRSHYKAVCFYGRFFFCIYLFLFTVK